MNKWEMLEWWINEVVESTKGNETLPGRMEFTAYLRVQTQMRRFADAEYNAHLRAASY